MSVLVEIQAPDPGRRGLLGAPGLPWDPPWVLVDTGPRFTPQLAPERRRKNEILSIKRKAH